MRVKTGLAVRASCSPKMPSRRTLPFTSMPPVALPASLVPAPSRTETRYSARYLRVLKDARRLKTPVRFLRTATAATARDLSGETVQ